MFVRQRTTVFAFRQAFLQIDQKYFAARAKSKFAVNLRYKDGRQLAAEHFDFYYKPIFRKRWPSIRLGLTSRSKTCGVVNNFGSNPSAVAEEFESSGAIELIPLLEECKRRRLDDIGNHQEKPRRSESKRNVEEATIDAEPNKVDTPEMKDPRSAATMNSFIMPTKFIVRETIPQWEKDEEGRPILDTWSKEDVEFLSDDDIIYPKYLRVFVHPLGEITEFDVPSTDERSTVRGYQLVDAAALFPVLAMDVRPNQTVLDMCAAPGEKALALLQTLIPCNLICNDASPARINLLKHTLRSYVQPGDDVSDRISFLRVDATNPRPGSFSEYDRVLVDVPNAEDRKNLRTKDADGNLFRRSLSNERLRLPDQQTQILMSGLKTLRRGGVLVYTTSTLSPNQNDEVVETALRRLRQDQESDFEFAVCDLKPLADDFYLAQVFRFYRQCRYGQLIIPFLPNNYGPVYTCKLKRVI